MLLVFYSVKRLVIKKLLVISLIFQVVIGRVGLFNFNFSVSFFQRFFQCFSVIFVYVFFQSGWSRFYQVFSFFQIQVSCVMYCFDNSNFVSVSSFQNYVEFSFFFSSFSWVSSYSYSSSSGNIEFFFYCRNQFYNVYYGYSGYCFNDLIFSDRYLNCF